MKLVEIEWVDSHNSSSDWCDIETIAETCELLHILSVGYVVAETPECITIVPHIYSETQARPIRSQGCGEMTIPKCSITKTNVLKEDISDETSSATREGAHVEL